MFEGKKFLFVAVNIYNKIPFFDEIQSLHYILDFGFGPLPTVHRKEFSLEPKLSQGQNWYNFMIYDVFLKWKQCQSWH